MRFIEGLATAYFDDDQNAVVVNFYGEGDTMVYRLAFQSALDMAAAYQVNKWIFIKSNFSDVDSLKFLAYVKEWMKPPKFDQSEIREVQILTKVQAVRKMNMLLKFNNLYNKDYQVNELLNISVTVNEEKLIPTLLQKSA